VPAEDPKGTPMPAAGDKKPANQDWQVHVESRLAGLETQVTSLGNILTNAVESLTKRMDSSNESIGSRIDDISKNLRDVTTQKPAWGTYAAWAAVVLAVMGLAAQGYIRDLGRVELRQGDLSEIANRNAAQLEGQGQRIAQNTKGIIDNKAWGVEQVVTVTRQMEKADGGLMKDLDIIRNWRDEYMVTDSARHATLNERMKALKETMDAHSGEAGHPWDIAGQIAEIRAELAAITSNLYTGNQGMAAEARLGSLEQQLSDLIWRLENDRVIMRGERRPNP